MTSVPDTGPTTETRRRPTPKPNHREAKVLHRADFIPHVWGDSAAGHVTDRVISSTRTLHVLEFELAPGGEFRHSPTNQTIFAGDVLYFVARGEIIVADPSSGHMVRATAGEACFIPPGTWHNGFNPFSTTARVIEFFRRRRFVEQLPITPSINRPLRIHCSPTLDRPEAASKSARMHSFG